MSQSFADAINVLETHAEIRCNNDRHVATTTDTLQQRQNSKSGRHIQRDTYRETRTERHIQRDTYRETHTERDIQRDTYRETHRKRHIERDT